MILTQGEPIPGDTGQCLGTCIAVMTGGVPGIKWGVKVLLSPHSAQDGPPKNDPAPVLAVARGQTLLRNDNG